MLKFLKTREIFQRGEEHEKEAVREMLRARLKGQDNFSDTGRKQKERCSLSGAPAFEMLLKKGHGEAQAGVCKY